MQCNTVCNMSGFLHNMRAPYTNQKQSAGHSGRKVAHPTGQPPNAKKIIKKPSENKHPNHSSSNPPNEFARKHLEAARGEGSSALGLHVGHHHNRCLTAVSACLDAATASGGDRRLWRLLGWNTSASSQWS